MTRFLEHISPRVQRLVVGAASPYHLIGTHQDRFGDRDAERFGGLEVDDQLELGRLLYGEVARLCALEDLVHVPSRSAEQIGDYWAVGHHPACVNILPLRGHGW